MATETKLRQLAQGGCPVYYFYSSERYLVRQAVARAAKLLAEGEDEETTVLDGAAPEIEQLIMAAGTISFFGTRRVVLLPEVDPAAYSDKDLDELCATLASLENAWWCWAACSRWSAISSNWASGRRSSSPSVPRSALPKSWPNPSPTS